MKLVNKTRSSSKIGYLVKSVSGGFEYAGIGDTPIGVVTEVVRVGAPCNIQTSGEAAVYVSKTTSAGISLKAPSLPGDIAGQASNVGTSTNHVLIGTTVGKGRGLVKVALSIGGGIRTSQSGGASVTSHFDLADIGVATHSAIDTHISVAAAHIADVTTNPHNVTATQVLPGQAGQAGEFLYTNGTSASWEPVGFDVTVNGSAPTPNTIVAGGTFDFLGDTTYIQIQWNQTTQQLEFSYVGPTDFYTGWDIWVDSIDTTRTVTSGMDVNFISGTYTTISHNFVTGPPPHNDLTFDIDTTALDPHYAALHYLKSEVYTKAEADAAFDNYANWVVEAGGVPVQTVSSGNAVNFAAGANMTVTWGGPDTLTFAMTTAFGTMSDWYMAVDYNPAIPVTHTIANHTIVDFQGGTYIDAAYTFVTPVHGVALDINTTALDAHYAGLHYLKSEVYTKTEADAAFDNYDNWAVSANGTPVSTVSSGGALNFAAGSNMTVTWGGPNTLTFAMTTSFGTMSSWNWEVLGVPHSIANGGTAEIIAGTNITIGYTLGGGGEHQATINADLSSYYTSAQVDAGFYSQTWIDTNIYTIAEADAAFDDYGGWDIYTGAVFRETIASGDRVDVVGGTDIQVTYTATGNILTIDYVGTPSYTSWNFEVLGVPHSIGNGGTAELIAGTGISITYSLGGSGEHQATISSPSTMVYPGAGIALSTGSAWGTSITDNSANWNTAFSWGDHAGLYDDYNGWDVYTGGVFRETIASGDRVDFIGGTDIQVTYGATGNTLTIAYTGTASYTSWNWEVLGVPHSIGNGGTAELIAGTGISIAYSLGGSGEHQATISSSAASSPWTADTNGITYTAGNVGIGVASHSGYDLTVEGTSWLKGAIKSNGTFVVDNLSYSTAYGAETVNFGRGSSNYIRASTTSGVVMIVTDGRTGAYTESMAYFGTEYAELRYGTGATTTAQKLVTTSTGITVTDSVATGNALGGKLYVYSTSYGIGIQSSLMQLFSSTSSSRIGLGYGTSAAFTETLTVKGANVGIGQTTPLSPLHIQGTLAAPPSLKIANSGGTWVTDTTEIGRLEFYSADGSGIGVREVAAIQGVCTVGGAAGAFGLAFFTSVINTVATEKMRLTDAGDLTVTGGIYAAGEVESYDTSDINLKENIERLDYKYIAKEMLSSSLISYDHKIKNKREIGWIAQEIDMFLPENVKYDDDGNLMIHYGKMAVALSAVDRYQQDQIETLQAEIKELKRKLAKY